MRNLPKAIKGFFFAPALILLFFLLKSFCPESAGNSCFSDQFSVPIFYPLIAIYRYFGSSEIIGGHDFLFILGYWAILGFLIGLILDLWRREKEVTMTNVQ
jgi:hypothetical protein